MKVHLICFVVKGLWNVCVLSTQSHLISSLACLQSTAGKTSIACPHEYPICSSRRSKHVWSYPRGDDTTTRSLQLGRAAGESVSTQIFTTSRPFLKFTENGPWDPLIRSLIDSITSNFKALCKLSPLNSHSSTGELNKAASRWTCNMSKFYRSFAAQN